VSLLPAWAGFLQKLQHAQLLLSLVIPVLLASPVCFLRVSRCLLFCSPSGRLGALYTCAKASVQICGNALHQSSRASLHRPPLPLALAPFARSLPLRVPPPNPPHNDNIHSHLRERPTKLKATEPRPPTTLKFKTTTRYTTRNSSFTRHKDRIRHHATTFSANQLVVSQFSFPQLHHRTFSTLVLQVVLNSLGSSCIEM
jgi:hypothetical protein